MVRIHPSLPNFSEEPRAKRGSSGLPSVQVLKISKIVSWWFNAVVTPGPIPNPAVKHRSGDGTRKGRVASRQDSVLEVFLVYTIS